MQHEAIRTRQRVRACVTAALAAAVAMGGCAQRSGSLCQKASPRAAEGVPASGAPAIEFDISSDFGDEAAAWTRVYLEKCAAALVRLMDNPEVEPPRRVGVTLKKDPNLPGIGGWATADSVGFVSDQWLAEANRYWIVAHELTNLFAHHYGGGGGYPSDWWSNGRSPFPEYSSCVVMREAGYPEEGTWRKVMNKGQPDHDMYWEWDRRLGFAMFARFFKLLREDGVTLGDIGAAWPAPDRARSVYTAAYLSLAAGENVAPVLRAAGVGKEPRDWRQRHPEIAFVEYEVRDENVERVMRERERLFGAGGRADEAERERFRNGAAVE